MNKLTLIALLSVSAVAVAAPAVAKTAEDVKASAAELEKCHDFMAGANEQYAKEVAAHAALVNEVEKPAFYTRGYKAAKNVAVETKNVVVGHKLSTGIIALLAIAIAEAVKAGYNHFFPAELTAEQKNLAEAAKIQNKILADVAPKAKKN